MKKHLSIILLVTIMMTVVALADGTNDLKFGMSEKEANDAMGSQGTFREIVTSFAGKLNTYIFRNVKISQFDDAYLNLAFYNDKLISKAYGFNPDENNNHYNYLKKALTKKYGDCEENTDLAAKFLELYGLGSMVEEVGIKTLISVLSGKLATWTTEDKTDIVLFCMSGDDSSATILTYMHALDDIEIEYDDSGL